MIQHDLWILRSRSTVKLHSVFSIRVKRAPKPDPVKRRPPTACRFYFTEPAVLLVYIFVTTPNMLMHLQSQATVVHHAALSPSLLTLGLRPPGPAFLASPLCHLPHLDLTNLQRLAHIIP